MSYRYFGLLMLLGAIWGASYLFIKIGVTEIGPLTVAMLRTGVGSLALLAMIVLKRERLPTDQGSWGHLAVMGMFNACIPFAIISWGTRLIPSGLSAILGATMPLFTFILAVMWAGEHLSLSRVLGVLVGLAGIIVLTWPQLRGGIQAGLWGQLAVVAGSFSYAVAIVYARRRLTRHSPIVASFGQVGTGFLFLAPLALGLEQPWRLSPSPRAIGALLALGVMGTGVAYVIYHRLIQGVGATVTSLVTNITPVFGVFWGWAILGERLAWNAFVALLMILLGLALVNNLRLGFRRRMGRDERR